MSTDYAIVAKSCHMQAARSRARRLTLAYETALAPLDLTGGQFSTLIAVAHAEWPAIHELAEHLVMDRTTMSRALKPLERRELVQLDPDPEDLRSKRVKLTAAGRDLLDRAIPLWAKVQNSIKE